MEEIERRGYFWNFQFLDRHIFFLEMRSKEWSKSEDTSMEISFRIFARNFQMHSFELSKLEEENIFEYLREISNSLIAIFQMEEIEGRE